MPTPPLILVPGLMCDQTVWEQQEPELRKRMTVTIADHRELDSLPKMAAAIVERAPARFAIAGHSMGGRVALEVFRQAQDRIAGIALMDTAFAPRQKGEAADQEAANRYALLEIAEKRGMRAMARIWSQRMVHPDRLSDSNLMDAIHDMIARKTPEIYAAQIKALLERPDAGPLLEQIRCPAMVLCGRQDSWSVLSVHEQMAARIAGSNLVVIEDCGHMSTMERPDEITASMLDWINSL
jgi:pimeloyl-ACP methyl ester carboxylesterase